MYTTAMSWFITYCIIFTLLFSYGLYAQRKENLGRWTTKDLKDEFRRKNGLK